jgi:hypothetical protein
MNVLLLIGAAAALTLFGFGLHCLMVMAADERGPDMDAS